MRGLANGAHRLRLVAMVALGAFAIHQLRYLIAFGGGSPEELASRGHGYLETLLPALAVLGMAAVAATVLRGFAGARGTGGSAAGRALVCACALLAIFGVQELLEWALTAGRHEGAAAALVGEGGWLALPLALAAGGLLSLALTGLETIERALAGRRSGSGLARSPRSHGIGLRARRITPLRAPLAFGLARRPPPSLA